MPGDQTDLETRNSTPPVEKKAVDRETARLNLGVFAYDSLRAIEKLAKSRRGLRETKPGEIVLDDYSPEGDIETAVEIKRKRGWFTELYFHLGLAQGRGFIDRQESGSLMNLVNGTTDRLFNHPLHADIDFILDNWNGPEKDKVRNMIAGQPVPLTDPVIDMLSKGRREIMEAGDYKDMGKRAGIYSRVNQASVYLQEQPQ